jgi:hypothetical protein
MSQTNAVILRIKAASLTRVAYGVEEEDAKKAGT